MNTNPTKIKYFLYARKSSESEDRQVLSIDSQIDELKKLAKREGLEIIGKPLYESQSAKEPGRPIFNQMLEQIHKGEAQGIICWKLDRLARNPIDGGSINWMLQQEVIKHIRAYDKDYYPTDNVLMMSVEFGMANQYLRDLSQNVKRGLRTKVEMGIYPAPASIGYVNDRYAVKGNKTILPDETRFDLVRELFDLMLTGSYTVPQIQKMAHKKLGLTMPSGRPISKTATYYLFTNPFYYGSFEYPRKSGNWYKGIHKPMITEEEYDKIQIILGRKGKPRPRSHAFAFTGMIRCGECGGMITAEEKTKRQKNGNVHNYIYYHCGKKKNPNCAQKCIEKKELNKQIRAKINKITIDPEFTEWALDLYKKENKKEASNITLIIDNLQKAYKAVVQKIKKINLMRADEELDEQEYKEMKGDFNKERIRLEALLADTSDRIGKWLDKADELFQFATTAKESFEKGGIEIRKRILANLGSNLLLKDRKISITIEKPLLYLEDASKELKRIHRGVEPHKNGSNKEQLASLYASSPILRRMQDSNLQGIAPDGFQDHCHTIRRILPHV